jgi:hypothetical protein
MQRAPVFQFTSGSSEMSYQTAANAEVIFVVIRSIGQSGDEVFNLYGADGDVMSQFEIQPSTNGRGKGSRGSCADRVRWRQSPRRVDSAH